MPENTKESQHSVIRGIKKFPGTSTVLASLTQRMEGLAMEFSQFKEFSRKLVAILAAQLELSNDDIQLLSLHLETAELRPAPKTALQNQPTCPSCLRPMLTNSSTCNYCGMKVAKWEK